MKPTTLLLVAVLSGAMAVGCAGKRRIEGAEEPLQPSTTPTPVVMAAAPTATATVEPAQPPPPPEQPPAPPAEEPPAPPEAKAEPTATPEPPPPPSNDCTSYIVVKGDTLWDISRMDLAYKDNFQWPLIFKANRDQIKDPDLIYPKQEFCIRHDFSQAEIDKARNDASDTPKYVPHTKPRETLPVDYF